MKLRLMTIWGIVAFTLLSGAAPIYSQAPAQGASSGKVGSEPIVVAVRIVRESDGRVLAESPSGISVEIGKPLDREKVAESLRALYKTGNYADLKAVVTPVTDGVRLDLMARENLFFNLVRLEGLEPPPTEASAAAAMQIGLGQTYRKQIVDEALERLRETLHEEGLYQAEVSARSEEHTSELQSQSNLVCRLLLEKKKKKNNNKKQHPNNLLTSTTQQNSMNTH